MNVKIKKVNVNSKCKQSECRQSKCENKESECKKNSNKSAFIIIQFYLFIILLLWIFYSHFCYLFISLISFITQYYHSSINMMFKGCLKKQYDISAQRLHAVQAADHCAVLVMHNKTKTTVEWENADEAQKKAILDHVKQKVMLKREDSGLSDRQQLAILKL